MTQTLTGFLFVDLGGENALVIHYIENNCRIPADALVLVDAGCDFHGYVSDVTRTWPVSGWCHQSLCTLKQTTNKNATYHPEEDCMKRLVVVFKSNGPVHCLTWL